ncbi:DUF6572 domain-containing protein [Phenylobacterium ferrooxidans]|uniref:Uncharacterized protein n=1 Tax=Phenylobacterium ferrooxidans TaxID=2982689 RepID=A0ABW6CKT0_9CAUL
MSIENAEIIDGLGTDKIRGEATLLISDHWPWSDEPAHFALLEAKISRYIDFVTSGQIFEQMPNARGLPICIKLIHQHDPSVSAARFLEAAGQQLAELGLRFSHASLPDT